MNVVRPMALLFALIATSCFAQTAVKISFLPPPLEGTISLGIYDEWGQLVRVLHQEATVDEFTIGADALVTSWDGKNDDGVAAPTGTYKARGFVVAAPTVQPTESNDTGGPAATNVKLKLVANPLEKNERGVAEISVGFDDENVYLKTADGLPLATIAPTGDTTKAWLTAGRENKLVTVFVSNGSQVRRFDVTGLDKMMAFDCGEIELK